MCPQKKVSGGLEHGTMEWSLIERIAEQLPLGSIWPMVVFSLHNEPLLDRRIFDVVKLFKSRGKYCRLVTNGSLLDRFEPADIVQSDLDELIISLNAASKEMYESTNTGLSYEKVMNGINLMLSNEYLRQRVCLSFVITQQNQNTIYQAIRYWRMRGVRCRLLPVQNVGGNLEDYENIKPRSLFLGNSFVSPISRYLKHVVSLFAGCVLPFYQMNILFNGDCIICCHDWTRSVVFSNVANTPLRDGWNSQKMNQIRQRMLRRQYELIGPCRKCTLGR
jgi:MoaA/NifB/PqqE/SkfB family radical SAM enzyme